MRCKLIVAALVGLAVVGEGTAFAAATEKDKGSTGGSTSSGATSEAGGSNVSGADATRDIGTSGAEVNKQWEVDVGAEYHRLIRATDLGGDSSSSGDQANVNLIYYSLGAGWNFTKDDKLSARWGIYQRFLADPGETGVRADDATVAFTHTFHLPAGFLVRVQPRVDIGVSYNSVELAGLIAAPRLGVSVDKKIGILDLYALVYGYYFFDRWTSYANGSQPTPQESLGALVEATVTMPFLRELEVGISASAGTTWYHTVGSTASAPYGSVSDPLVYNQPFSNSYGGEIFARYELPRLDKVAWDVLVAYADGDPTLGNQGLLHDGLAHLDLFYRHVSEFYGVVTFRY